MNFERENLILGKQLSTLSTKFLFYSINAEKYVLNKSNSISIHNIVIVKLQIIENMNSYIFCSKNVSTNSTAEQNFSGKEPISRKWSPLIYFWHYPIFFI